MNKIKVFLLSLMFFIVSLGFVIYNNSYGIDKPERNNIITRSNDDKIVSLYCWYFEHINLSKLKEEVDYLGVNTLYIYRPGSNDEIDRLKQIMEFAKENKIDVYLLDGDADWLTNESHKHYVYDVINLADEINKELDYKIKGVQLDVEFYGLTGDKTEQKELFRTFIKNTVEVNEYAKSVGLGYSMALSTNFDENGMSEELEELMKSATYDHLVFMNYSRTSYKNKIAYEVELAKKYDVTIVSAAEADWVDESGVGFYDQGIEALLESLEDIQNTYPYEKLGLGFHHYNPIKDLMVRINQGIENKYELEVSSYLNDKSVKVDSAVITDKDGNEYKPIPGYHSKNDEYVINFYGLTYGEEYTITIKSGNATATKTFTYGKSDIKNDIEIAYDKIELTESDDEDPETPDDDNKDDDKKDDDDNKDDNNEDDNNKDDDNKDNEDNEDDKKDDEEQAPGEQPENPDLDDDNNDIPTIDDEENPNVPEESEQNPYPNQNGNIFENEDSPNTHDRIIVDTIINIVSIILIVINSSILFIKNKM